MICFDLIGFYLEFLVKKYGAWLHKCMKSKSSNFDGVIMKNVFPNITGSFTTRRWGNDGMLSHNHKGAFSGSLYTYNTIGVMSSGIEHPSSQLNSFAANKSNSIYKSATAQPSSIRVLSIVRT